MHDDGASSPDVDQPLTGITVIDLGHVYAAPYCTLLMALSGARVIKVEPPGGEHLRVRSQVGGPAYVFAMLNSNKECVTIDLKTEQGKVELHSLLGQADVLVENFRPGVMSRLGFDADELVKRYPRLIYAQSSGFGRSGPMANIPAMDLTVQAIGGVMSTTGYPDGEPLRAGPALCDFSGGSHLFGAITAALLRRERTAKGGIVEVAMIEAVFPALASNLGQYFATGSTEFRTGNRHGGMSVAPYNVYPTIDGYVAVICESDAHWARLVRLMQRDDLATDPVLDLTAGRVSRMDEIDQAVSDWTSELTADEVFVALSAVGVPGAQVRNLAQVANDPNLFDRGMLHKVAHPDLGEVTLMQRPIVFDGETRATPTPSRRLGEDNDAVFIEWLGLDRPGSAEPPAGEDAP